MADEEKFFFFKKSCHEKWRSATRLCLPNQSLPPVNQSHFTVHNHNDVPSRGGHLNLTSPRSDWSVVAAVTCPTVPVDLLLHSDGQRTLGFTQVEFWRSFSGSGFNHDVIFGILVFRSTILDFLLIINLHIYIYIYWPWCYRCSFVYLCKLTSLRWHHPQTPQRATSQTAHTVTARESRNTLRDTEPA